jgi:short-subunit dehydrogenase
MRSLSGLTAIVTGASSGIGEALALGLARQRVTLRLTGRDPVRLAAVAQCAGVHSPEVRSYVADLSVDDDLASLQGQLLRDCTSVDVLIHAAATLQTGPVALATVADFDLQYRTNLRAPYQLTQALLPRLVASQGQVVFLNSSVGLNARAGVAQYAATKHGLRAFADALRAEVNAQGVRVLSLYLGRTATPGQERLHAQDGKPYAPEQLLQADDVVSAVLGALSADSSAEITDLSIRPMRKG